MARKYVMKTRIDRAYANYQKRYNEKVQILKRKGYTMADTMLSKQEYLMVRGAYMAEGRTTNINQTIVADQAYEYSQKVARQMKKTAEKYDLAWKNKSITELRKGGIDVSAMNEELKILYPDWTGLQRQQWISYEVFGSD